MGPRLSVREKKTLLLLLRFDENGVDYASELRSTRMIEQILEPPTEYTTTIASPLSQGVRIIPHLNEGSWNRTFLRLRREGLVVVDQCHVEKRWKGERTPDGGFVQVDEVQRAKRGYPRCRLTQAGEEKTGEIREEIRAYFAEWSQLLPRGNYTYALM